MRVASNDFEPAPSGIHQARCCQFIDQGNQLGEYMGERTDRHQCLVAFELSDVTDDEDRPFLVFLTLTLSMHESASMRKHIEGWFGHALTKQELRDFDTRQLIGRPCTLTIERVTGKSGGRTYAKVVSINAPEKGLKPPPLRSKEIYLEITKEGWSQAVYDTLSEKMKTTIAASPQYREVVLGLAPLPTPPLQSSANKPTAAQVAADIDDDIPF